MATTQAFDGTTIHFDTTESSAESSAVVLVHGITESAATWDPIVERLAPSRTVVTMDLRGHGRSGHADRYDLEAMGADVAAVIDAAGVERPDVVGHSLGGLVASAVGASVPVRSVVNIDQSLQLGEFKAQLVAFEDQLRATETFPLVIEGLFESMTGARIADVERDRVNAQRRADQDVVLGVWEMLFTASADEIAATIDGALAGYSDSGVPYLTVFGIEPADGYDEWISARIDGAVTEVWPDHGHYPHLVEPDRFVECLERFWT